MSGRSRSRVFRLSAGPRPARSPCREFSTCAFCVPYFCTSREMRKWKVNEVSTAAKYIQSAPNFKHFFSKPHISAALQRQPARAEPQTAIKQRSHVTNERSPKIRKHTHVPLKHSYEIKKQKSITKKKSHIPLPCASVPLFRIGVTKKHTCKQGNERPFTEKQVPAYL